jgi:CheY-like chemotaxis protein
LEQGTNQFGLSSNWWGIIRQLSGVDGLEVCRTLKSGEHSKHIPVIVLSASPDIIAQADEAGTDQVPGKPFHIKTLREMVAKVLDEGPL